jgi:hypothetical protein
MKEPHDDLKLCRQTPPLPSPHSSTTYSTVRACFARPKCLLVYPDGDPLSISRGKHATELIMDGPYSSHLSTTKCAVVAHGDAFCRPRFVEHRTSNDIATSLPHCHMYDVTPVHGSYQAHTGDEYCTLGPSYQFSCLSALAGFVLLYITEHHHPPEASLQKAFFRFLGSSCVSHYCLVVLCLHGHIYYTRDSGPIGQLILTACKYPRRRRYPHASPNHVRRASRSHIN